MATVRPTGEVSSRWRAFARALRSILGGLPQHRHQDQFIRVRDLALDLAESNRMADEVEACYMRVVGPPDDPSGAVDAAEIVVLELECYAAAVSVHSAEEKAGTAKPGALKSLANAAKTVMGSVDDVFEMTKYGKGVLAVVKEGLELVAGN